MNRPGRLSPTGMRGPKSGLAALLFAKLRLVGSGASLAPAARPRFPAISYCPDENVRVTWDKFDLFKLGGTAVLAFIVGRLSKRLDRRQERKDAKAKLAPAFELEHVSGQAFRLVNVGDADATGVTL